MRAGRCFEEERRPILSLAFSSVFSCGRAGGAGCGGVGWGALGWVVTPWLLRPLLLTSRIKSGWSRLAELGLRALEGAPESWVGERTHSPVGPLGTWRFSPRAARRSRGELDLGGGRGRNTGFSFVQLGRDHGSGLRASGGGQRLYPHSGFSYFHFSFFPLCLPSFSLCRLFWPLFSPCRGRGRAGAAPRLTKAAGGEGRSGRGICWGRGGSIRRPSGVQWSRRQSFEGQPRQRVASELAREVGWGRRIPAQAGPSAPPTLCPSDWGAIYALLFPRGWGCSYVEEILSFLPPPFPSQSPPPPNNTHTF